MADETASPTSILEELFQEAPAGVVSLEKWSLTPRGKRHIHYFASKWAIKGEYLIAGTENFQHSGVFPLTQLVAFLPCEMCPQGEVYNLG